MSLATVTKVVPYAKAIAFGLAACVVCSLLGFGAGLWAGIEWQQGRAAQVENKDLKADVESLLTAAVDLRQRGADIAQDFRTAHRRMEAISDDHEQRTATMRQFFDQHQIALADLVAANPRLRDDCLGLDGVQHWNAAARGARAAGPAAEPSGAVTPVVPRGAADAEHRDGPADSRDVDPRRGAVPGLREPTDDAGATSAGVPGGSVGALLHGDRGARHRRAGLLAEVSRG